MKKLLSHLLILNILAVLLASCGTSAPSYNYKELARAGAGIANNANMTIIIGGELKPGIRTPEVNAFELIILPPKILDRSK